MKTLKLFAVCGLTAVLLGCASAKLVVEVDLYDEDPRVLLPPSPQDNMALYAQAEVLLQEARANRNASKQWKSEVLNIYKSLWLSAGGSATDDGSDTTANRTSCAAAFSAGHPLQHLSAAIINNNNCEEESIDALTAALQQLLTEINHYNDTYLHVIATAKNTYATKCLAKSDVSLQSNTREIYQSTVTEVTATGEKLTERAVIKDTVPRTIDVSCTEQIRFEGAGRANKNSQTPTLDYEKRQCHKKIGNRYVIVPCDRHTADNEVWLTESQFIEKSLAAEHSLFALQHQVLQRLSQVVNAFSAYQNLPNVYVDWASLESLVHAKWMQAGSNKLEQERLYRLVDDARGRIQNLSDRLVLQDEQKHARAKARQQDLTALQRGQIKIDFVGFNRKMPFAGSIKELLAQQASNTSGLYDLIDRLQDVGDPIWRTVTDPLNEHHWNKKVGKTFVQAQGKTSMVIVRDTPLHFRAHHVENDPSNLIRGQLEIARAVGDAAMTIAGVKLGGTASASAPNADNVDINFTVESAASELEQNKQVIAQKRKALVGMIAQLRAFQKDLDKLENDTPGNKQKQKEYETALNNIRNQIIGVLSGYKTHFEVAK